MELGIQTLTVAFRVRLSLLKMEDQGVRAVEVAPGGLRVAQIQVQPLQPDVMGTVPRPVLGGPG